jgi:hypothetical protein
MHPGEQYSTGPDLAGAPERVASPPQLRPDVVGQEDSIAPAARRWWVAAAWVAGGLALFAFFLRISLSFAQDSDGANNALQAWDLLHGNLLLHGWIIGDATFYTFELPLFSVTEAFFGLHSLTIHVACALIYVIVVGVAVAVARTDSRGLSTAIRCGVVIAVLAAPLLTLRDVSIMLEHPDHIGTSAILVVGFLLIDRAPGRRFTPPLLCAILFAGQLGDATVLYVGVPAVLIVCAYRILTSGNIRAGLNIRTGDMAIAVAAAVSVPLASLARDAIVHFGGYLMIPPQTSIAPIGQWPHHAELAAEHIRTLFGVTYSGAVLGTLGVVFGLACLLAATFGFGKVIWTWRSASRAEQLLCLAIVINIGVYVVSTIADAGNARELDAVVTFGAILAARACVPGRIVGVRQARVAIAAAAVVALLPLGAAATRPPATPAAVRLATWLEAHRLTYGIGGYWDASAVTVQSGDRVEVRAITLNSHDGHRRFAAFDWETKASWYDPNQHDATFAIADRHRGHEYFMANVFEKYLPRPVATYQVAGCVILVYRTNLLRHVVPALPLRPPRSN